MKLPDAARSEILGAIETYRAFVDDRSPTGAQQRKQLVEISKQAAALAVSIASLSFWEKWHLLEARGLDLETLSPATAEKFLTQENDKLVHHHIALRDASATASAKISNSKRGKKARAEHTSLLVHFLDDILIRHSGQGLKTSNHPLTFAIRIFEIADQPRQKRDRTSERSITDAIAYLVNQRGPIEQKTAVPSPEWPELNRRSDK